MTADPRLIIALDVPTRDAAEHLVRSVDDAVSFTRSACNCSPRTAWASPGI